VLLNAGAALLVAGRAESLAAGIAKADDSLTSGRARRVLETLRTVCAK
jgi:anthranilate phosphoribosyltransferase